MGQGLANRDAFCLGIFTVYSLTIVAARLI
jgi:hypothetical protein